MMRNCAQAPMRISSGRRASILKSLVVSVSPIVSMMMPRMTVCIVPRTHSKRSGTKKVSTAMAVTKSEAWAASHRLRRCNDCNIKKMIILWSHVCDESILSSYHIFHPYGHKSIESYPFESLIYSLGSMPNSFLKSLVKYFGVLKPTSMESSVILMPGC